MREGIIVRIAICDDEMIFTNSLCNLIKTQFSEQNLFPECVNFNNALGFLRAHNANRFDLVFLDIDMPEISGFAVSEKIVSEAEIRKPYIIYVTNRDDLVFKSFEYQPFAFIRKKYLTAELQEVIQRLATRISESKKFIMVKKNEKIFKLEVSNIIYIESRKNNIDIHTINNIYSLRETMAKIEITLEHDGFVRIHSGYLVNCRYIFSIEPELIKLEDGVSLPLSRYRANDVKIKFQKYMRDYHE